jgi:tyrosyl-tRNA synthetase
MPLLVGTDGVQKMSKSLGNYIGVTEPPEDIYGKTMSIKDEVIMLFLKTLTDVPDKELADYEKQLKTGLNPMTLKKLLARELITQLYGEKEAAEAAAYFEKTVQNKEVPEDIMEYLLENDTSCSQLLAQSGLCASRSEAVRLIKQGAVTINGKKISDANETVSKGVTIKVGKRRYLRTK